MRSLFAVLCGLAAFGLMLPVAFSQSKTGVLDFKLKGIDGSNVELSKYQGKVVLLVNVASKCGLTPQYKDLQALYEKYKDQGFVVVGVPANDFGKQEPGTDAEISTFCTTKYNVTFPMLSKVSVKGVDITPLYAYLTSKDTNPQFAGPIQWNFTKFLVGRDGKVVDRFEPRADLKSDAVIKSIEAQIAKK